MEANVEVNGLRKRFEPTVALDGTTFTALPGQITGSPPVTPATPRKG